MSKLFLKTLFNNIKGVSFTVELWDGETIKVGEGEDEFTVIIKEPIHEKDLLTSTTLTLGEAYMDGNIKIEGDLYYVLDKLLSIYDNFSTKLDKLPKIFKTSKDKKCQKKEVCSHYNLGNDFYSKWLDETMSYSCAYFKKEDDTLYDAQMNKIHHILKKLNLQENMSLLDIGCGWGYLLVEAAKKYKVKGTGITLSEEQYKGCLQRIKEEGLEDYVNVMLMDYRDLKKSGLLFDRVVSVGMIEHVERENYKLFFDNVNSVLKKKGLFLLHYISSVKEGNGDAWIRKYIFPGGIIPSLREIIDVAGDYKYHTIDVENLRLHYKKTLLMWYENFMNNLPEISKDHDERFIRMWQIYLASCAASFNNGVIDLHQILFTKGVNNTLPMTREYLYKE